MDMPEFLARVLLLCGDSRWMNDSLIIKGSNSWHWDLELLHIRGSEDWQCLYVRVRDACFVVEHETGFEQHLSTTLNYILHTLGQHKLSPREDYWLAGLSTMTSQDVVDHMQSINGYLRRGTPSRPGKRLTEEEQSTEEETP